MKVGMLTGGGDCPGLNAVIRAAVKGEQLHAMRTLHLITVPYLLRSLPEHLRAAKAFDLDLLVHHCAFLLKLFFPLPQP